MTCIVAVSDGVKVVIGGDSASVKERDLRVRATRKVFSSGAYVIGYTRSFRMGQILQHGMTLPVPPKAGDDLERFMVTEFVDAIRAGFKAGGYAMRENEKEIGGVFLVGVHGRLFEVRSDYHVAIPAGGYAAVGFGGQVALGALHALHCEKPVPLSLKERAEAALSASEAFCAAVRAPFYFAEAG